MTGPIGLYLHIPFCGAKCPYCDFYSGPAAPEARRAYVDALCRAMERQPYGSLGADTFYLGGGTPSLLDAGDLLRLLDTARTKFGLVDAEITLEANPGTVNLETLKRLHRGGFNRISFGVQSLQAGELAALGRRHTAGEAEEAILLAQRAGFDDISADVMLGIPQQDKASLEHTLTRLTVLPVTHISAYLLKVEQGTPFADADLALPDEDETAALYLHCVSQLAQAGFAQYEISNFARAGHRSRHNLKYWQSAPYLGFGPAAHSYLHSRRFYFPRDLDAFAAAEDIWSLTVDDGEGGGMEEYAMLRLRLTDGLDLGELERQFAADTAPIRPRAELLQQKGLVRLEDDRISLTPEGFLLSNTVTAKLLYG